MIKIGITGGVGSGKSAVMEFLRNSYRCVTVRSDEISRELVEKDGSCYKDVAALFGGAAVRPDGGLDRPYIAGKVFSDPLLLEKLNSIIHPAVIRRIKELSAGAEKAGMPFFFLESALLADKNYGDLCDELWYVYADEKVRRERLKASRGYSDEKITEMIGSQTRESEFREKCSFVIDNSGDFARTEEAIISKMAELIEDHSG